jgi:hypothetical protein
MNAVNPVLDPDTSDSIDAMACTIMYACDKATRADGELHTNNLCGNWPWWTLCLLELKDTIQHTLIANQGKAMGRFKHTTASTKSQFWRSCLHKSGLSGDAGTIASRR